MPLSSFEKDFPAVVGSLMRARRNDRLAHAYLIYSDEPALGRSFGLALAQLFTCISPRGTGDACGSCEICRKIENGTYPELYSLSPSSKSREIPIGKDGDDIDTMRWFQAFFYLSSVHRGGVKIGAIWNAECMNDDSQSSFLKTLEDPPKSSFFILATASPFALLPTIRSRCQFLCLLKNSSSYKALDEATVLLSALHRLQFGPATIATAEECASSIDRILKNMHGKAEKSIEPKWKKILAEAANLAPPVKKKLELRWKAAIEAEYLGLRASFLSLIHTWFAQAYMVAAGVPAESLANPEIFSGFDIAAEPADGGRYRYFCMKKAGELLRTLDLNVKPEFAILDFCISIALRKE